jgi:hypothetical protein
MLRNLTIGLALSGLAMISLPLKAQEPPSKVFILRNIPLSRIFDEWRKNGNTANLYVCACNKEICDAREGWPYRKFRTGESMPALGEDNLNSAQWQGFICGLLAPSIRDQGSY